MSAEQNKALVRRWFAEMISTNNLGIADELAHTDKTDSWSQAGSRLA